MSNISKKFSFFIIIIISLINQTYASEKKATISVAGSYTTLIENNQATIYAHIETVDNKAKGAVNQNAAIMENIRNALKKINIDTKKLISKGYNLKTNYDYVDRKQIFRNYQVIHQISITTTNLENIGILTDLLTSSGVNHISNIEFSSNDTKKAYSSALKNAVLDAHNKANLAISGINNMTVGKAISINIKPANYYSNPVMYQASTRMHSISKETSPTKFNTEGQKITVNVQTVWEIHSK